MDIKKKEMKWEKSISSTKLDIIIYLCLSGYEL